MKDSIVGVGILGSSSSSIALRLRPQSAHHNRTSKCSWTKPKPHTLSASSSPSPSTTPPKRTRTRTRTRILLNRIGLSCRRNGSIKYSAELASKLAEEGRLEEFLMIADSILAASSSSSRSHFASLLNLELVSSGISRLLQRGGRFPLFVRVLTCLDQLGFDVPRLLPSLLHTLDLDQLLIFIQALQGSNLAIEEVVEVSWIIRLCVNKRNPSAAIRIANILPHSQMIFCTIILEFGKKGDLASALTVFEASKQGLASPNMFAYRTIIDVCGLCGDYMRSRSIYEELLACKFIPNVYFYNSLMNVNACDIRYSLQVYKQMKRLGVRADLASYNILLKSCGLAARVDLARDIYKEVQRLEAVGALKLDVFTYTTIIKVFADSKMWPMALNVKEDMLSAGVTPNTVTWISLISASANAGLVEQTICLFEEMLFAGCSPNSQCFNILLHACVESRQYDRAFRLFQSWKLNGCHETDRENGGDKHRSTAIDSADGNCVTNIPYQTSAPHSSRLPLRVPFKPTTSTYNTLMKACGTDYYRAKGLMDEMKKMGLSPNNISWSILIDICGGSGNVEGALQILRCMREGGIQPDVITYTTAIKVCVESKNIRYAFLLYAEMKRYQIKPNMVTYNTLLQARSKYGSSQEVKQCLAIYQDMRKAGYRSNDYYLKRLIEEWCEEAIQNSNRHKCNFNTRKDTHSLSTQSQLLEKVAEHLHKSDADSTLIDLRRLSKIEARIVVLAVLRMVKERYMPGNAIQDDLLIILGVDNRPDAKETGVERAIIKLLKNDMGLEVLTGKYTGYDGMSNPGSLDDSNGSRPEFEVLERTALLTHLGSSTRRPTVMKRIKVSKESLYQWLQRRCGDSSC